MSIAFTIWVDADACPTSVKDIIFRTAIRLKIAVVLVANGSMQVPKSEFIRLEVVRHGADIADNWIIENLKSDDLVITGDIPLASRAVTAGAIAIGTRGELYDDATVHGRLGTRNLMEQFRSAGIETSGPKPFSQKDVQTFANQLDRLVTRKLRG